MTDAATIPGADDPGLREWLRAEADAPFSGWDFSHLAGRLREEPTPWDYRAIVRAALPGCATLIDMGTGTAAAARLGDRGLSAEPGGGAGAARAARRPGRRYRRCGTIAVAVRGRERRSDHQSARVI